METLKLGIEGLDQIELIGRGGSSRVYRARQVDLDRMVALKVLNASDDADVVRRFDRERRAMGRLSENEGIVPVYSTGLTDNGEPYLLMPYYVQGSLQDRLESGPVPWPEAVEYMVAVANTMAAAHRSGVVHLDLKPANILLSSNGSPRIADFGIAKLLEQGGSKTTGAAFTPTFSAPEALLGDVTSPASDVYGLGATLWALIAGRPPFRDLNGDNALMAVVGRVVHQPVPDLRDRAPDAVCSVIERAMAKQPEGRYPTAGTFAQALTEAAEEARRQPRGNGHTPPDSGRTRLEQSAPAAGGALAGRRPPSQLPDSGPIDGAAALTRTTSAQPRQANGRLFQDPVPPPFVPVDPNLYDDPTPSRGTVAVLAAGGVILLIVALITVLTLMGGGAGGDETPTTASLATGAATSRSDGAEAGAFGGTGVAGPTTDTTTADQSLVTPTTSATTTPSLSDPSSSLDSTSSPTDTSATSTPTSPTSAITTPTSSPTSATSNTTRPTTNTSVTSTPTSPTSATTTPLEPPTDVTAELSADKADVQVSWTPSASAGVTGYTVLRTSSTGTTFEIKITGRAQKAVIDSSVIAGQTYTYKVRATGAGTSTSVYSASTAPVSVPEAA